MRNRIRVKRSLRRLLLRLQSVSIPRKVILTFLVGFGVLTVSLVEYVFRASQSAGVEQIEYLVRMTTLNAYNEIEATYRRVDRGELSPDEAQSQIRDRITGPLIEVYLSTRKAPMDLEKQLRKVVGLVDPRALQGVTFRPVAGRSGEVTSFQADTPGGKGFVVHIEDEGDHTRFRIRSPELVRQIYESYHHLPDDRRTLLKDVFRLRFIRHLAGSSIKIGSDGYVYALRTYEPGWRLPDTRYPEDYSFDAISRRYAANFAGTGLSGKALAAYLASQGETPEKNYANIQRDMMQHREDPAGAIADVHPYLEDVDLDNSVFENVMVVRNIVQRREGYYRYTWQNPTDRHPRTKVVFMKTFVHSKLDAPWVVACGAYEDEAMSSLQSLHRDLYLIAIAIVLVLTLLVVLFMKLNLLNPLDRVLEGIREVNRGNLETRIQGTNRDEIGFVAKSFNRMVRSIQRSNLILQEHAHTLESRVAERTRELQDTLGELESTLATVQALKTSQDGDYYLTSLLLKPLGANLAQSETVGIDFIIKQKKQFVFRKWEGELGGDLCIARSIKLKQRDYTVFLNADAMGKSIQGAGGALVLGSVFESILERTQSSFLFKDYYPERWIKNSFMELKKIFESFNGAMGASVVMGLVEDATGMVYFINADHPSGVLYRKGHASFISSEARLKRLGVEPDPTEIVAVETLQMKPGDVLFFGSDGKDDIRIEEENERSMNDDETMFLRLVETSYGDLPLIVSTIQKLGEVHDDLSILRIAYQPAATPDHRAELHDIQEEVLRLHHAGEIDASMEKVRSMLEIDPHHRRALIELVKYHVRREEYEEAIRFGEKYVEENPADNEILYTLSFAYRKQQQYARSIDVGERVYLRDPRQLRNLLNLAYCYTRTGNIARSEYFLEKVFTLDPENHTAHRLVEMLQGPA